MINKEQLTKMRKWLCFLQSSDCIDDPEELFECVEAIIELIDFWLKHN
jgi:hypothetical protein